MYFAATDRPGGQTARADGHQLFKPSMQNGSPKKRPQTSTGRTNQRIERQQCGRSQADPSIYAYVKTGEAEHAATLNGARKSRIDKFQSRFTFSHSDPKYYSELPVQPATGWWKALITSRRQSPCLVDRLCRHLDILIPDTIYTTSTECYYITNSPLALDSSSIRAQQLALPENATAGWLIKEDFSASKLFERNAGHYLASFGFPSGHMRRRPSARLLRSDPKYTLETGMAAPAAVVKQPHYAAANKNVAKALDLPSMSSLLADSSSERLVQVFVHGKRWSRCQLTRAAWRAGSMPIGFTFINKLTPEEARQANLDVTGQFCVSCDNVPPTRRPTNGEFNLAEDAAEDSTTKRRANGPSSTFDVFTLSGASLAEAAEIAHKLLLLTQTVFKLWLDTLVVDLVKGCNGKWYLLQVKSFTLRQSGPRVDRTLKENSEKDMEEETPEDTANTASALRKQQISLMQPSICAMCGLKRNKKALNRMMNHRMMLEAQHHMRKRGVDILFFHRARRQQLSAESAVCGTCYSLYLAEKELIQLETELGRETGQQISSRAEKLCFVTGILDAIQGSFLMKDPDLLELLQAFENSCQSAETADPQPQPTDGAFDELEEQSNEDDILATITSRRSDRGTGRSLEQQGSDLPQTTDAQGALVTFHGGEAIQTGPSSLPYDIVLPAALHQWRLMLFLDSLQDPPPYDGSYSRKPYLLQLSLFGQTSPVLLPCQEEDGIVRIRRMLIFYLFSNKPTITEVFKEELQFSLRSGDSADLTCRSQKKRAQSAAPHRQCPRNGLAEGPLHNKPEGPTQYTAVGSCSLGRLAGKRSVKNKTCVLLFEGDNGRCRLRITLGLHRDMQVPSQYVSVVPFRDAFVTKTPYCCSCPLPAEWLDCFLAQSDSCTSRSAGGLP